MSKWSKLIEFCIVGHSGVRHAGAAVATQSHSGNKCALEIRKRNLSQRQTLIWLRSFKDQCLNERMAWKEMIVTTKLTRNCPLSQVFSHCSNVGFLQKFWIWGGTRWHNMFLFQKSSSPKSGIRTDLFSDEVGEELAIVTSFLSQEPIVKMEPAKVGQSYGQFS